MPQLSFHAPIGDISIAEEDGFIVSVDWGWSSFQESTPLLIEAQQQLEAYFDGLLKQFDLPINPYGTPYQKKVWQALQSIPYGKTCFYGDISKKIGGSPRSVGNANAINPIPIIIPCHRVIARNSLGGYSGEGGSKTKKFLLNLEAHNY